MKALVYLLLMLFLVSCGGGSKNGSSSSTVSPIASELNHEERNLMDELLLKDEISEREVIRLLLKLETLNESTLKRLDQHLKMDCLNTKCRFVKKDSL